MMSIAPGWDQLHQEHGSRPVVLLGCGGLDDWSVRRACFVEETCSEKLHTAKAKGAAAMPGAAGVGG